MPAKTVLFTGITGYIGGSVILRFLDFVDHEGIGGTYEITALVRSQEKIDKLKQLKLKGVSYVLGSTDDRESLANLAAKADIVFSITMSQDFGAAKAILDGLKARHIETGTVPILIHTTGAGVFWDKSDAWAPQGKLPDVVKTWTDIPEDRPGLHHIAEVPDTAYHRDVELAVVAADTAGYIKSYIILPPNVYGRARGALIDAGIQNPYSMLMPFAVKTAIARGAGGILGEGTNVWPHAHVDDVADLYIVVFKKILSDPETAHGEAGYYFAENGVYVGGKLATTISAALHRSSNGKFPEKPVPFTEEEIEKTPKLITYLGPSCRMESEHSRSIGWKPKYTTEDFYASIQADVDAQLRKLAELV